jgi:hypothetical protein
MSWLLERMPQFREDWDAHLRRWGEDPGIGLDVAAFSRFVLKRLQDAGSVEAQRIFDLIEELATRGDEAVQTAATTQCLENLVNHIGAGRLKPEAVVPYLGPESRRYCIAWDDFTGVATPGLK